jgi:hypothetical protein
MTSSYRAAATRVTGLTGYQNMADREIIDFTRLNGRKIPKGGPMIIASAVQVMPVQVMHSPTAGTIWSILGVIAGAGAVGGLVNGLLGSSGGGLSLPKPVHGVLQLGFLGNVLLGAFGAVATWGLYGPLKDAVLVGANPGNMLPANLTVTAIVGAALTGAGGAKVVSNEIDKRVLKKTAVEAAKKDANPDLAATIASSAPLGALDAVMNH